MSTIKWISKEVTPINVQELLNLYRPYLIPESVQITQVATRLVLVTFLLDQTFDSIDELNGALKKLS